jgi:hypothetical protein
MKYHFSILFFVVFCLSCSSKNNRQQTPKQEKINKPIQSVASKPPEKENSDTLIVTTKTAVFYFPNKGQLVRMKKAVGEENFHIGQDDYLSALHTAYDFLDSNKIPIVEAKDKKYVKFIRSDFTFTIIKLETLAELWGIYFFDPSKKEKLIDINMPEEEYLNYFQ